MKNNSHPSFEIYPAIDLLGGQVVRLLHGRADRVTTYYDSPLIPAREWLDAGTRWIHMVDLDAAFSGTSTNLALVSEVARLGVSVQMGGGMRSIEAVEQAIASGISRVVVGTAAVENQELIRELVGRFGPAAIAVGIDAKDGQVAVRGWVEGSGVSALEFARSVQNCGVRTIIYTDIATDGALTGPNIEAQREMVTSTGLHVIASGGISSMEDVNALRKLHQQHPRLAGVIVGRALYEKRVTVAELLSPDGD